MSRVSEDEDRKCATLNEAAREAQFLVKQPTISVVMAVFNCETVIDRAINSLLAQTRADWELIVVDDCSTDSSAKIVERFAEEDPRIYLIRRTQNGGPSAARNAALNVARGSWLAILDADDAWMPERLARLVAIAESTGREFVADNQILYDDGLLRPVGTATTFPHHLCAFTAEDLFKSEHETGSFQLSLLKPLLSAQFIREHNVRYAEALRFAEDMRFYAELLILGARAVLTNEAMYIYTTPVGKISRLKAKSSKTDNRADIKVAIADDILIKYRHRIATTLVKEIVAYRARARQQFHAQRLTELRDKRDIRRLILLVLLHPRLSFRYAAKSSAAERFTKRSAKGRSSQHQVSLAALQD